MNATLWAKEALEFQEVQEVLLDNKNKILKLINTFKNLNPEIKDNFYILGTSTLIMQNYLAKKHIIDVDIYCDGVEGIDNKPDGIHIVKNDLLPPGWRDRVVNIDGINYVSVFDEVCALAFSYTKKPLRKILLLWMLRDFDLEQVKSAMKGKIESGIGVTESDIQHYNLFCKHITAHLVDLNRNPHAKILQQLQEE